MRIPVINPEHAATVTYTGAGATAVLWGLHISDVCMIVSATAAVVGVTMQIWVARAKVAMYKRGTLGQRWKQGDK